MQTGTVGKRAPNEGNGDRIYYSCCRAQEDRPSKRKDQSQRGESETGKGLRLSNTNNNGNNECGSREERLIGRVGASNQSNRSNSSSGGGGRKSKAAKEKRRRKRHVERATLIEASLSIETSNKLSATDRIEANCDQEKQTSEQVKEQQSNLEPKQKQKRQQQQGQRYFRRPRRRSGGRQRGDQNKPAEASKAIISAESAASNTPNYLARLSKLSLSAAGKGGGGGGGGDDDDDDDGGGDDDDDSRLDEHNASASESVEATERKSTLERGDLSPSSESRRQIVLDHYVRHNIEGLGSANQRCGCHFNRLRGVERKRNLLSELEEFYTKKFQSKTCAGNGNGGKGGNVSSSGRLTARASELSIYDESDVDAVGAGSLADATHLEGSQARNLKLAARESDRVLSERGGACKRSGGLFIEEAAGEEEARGASKRANAQLAFTCANCDLTSGKPFSRAPITREANATENETEHATRSDYFHCQCHLVRISSSPNSRATGKRAAADCCRELSRVAQIEAEAEAEQQQERQQQQQVGQTTSEFLQRAATSSPLVPLSQSEEDRQVSSLSWDRFDLFAPSEPKSHRKASETEEHQQGQFTTNSGGRLTPTAGFCAENLGASSLLLASGFDREAPALEESPFSFEEAASLLTYELASSEAGNALESFAESSLEEEEEEEPGGKGAPVECDCACKCCREEQRARRLWQIGDEQGGGSQSTWSISASLAQQLAADIDTASQRRRRLIRPNSCRCRLRPSSLDCSERQRFGNSCSLTAENSALSLAWQPNSAPNDDNNNNKVGSEIKDERAKVEQANSELERRSLDDLNFKLEGARVHYLHEPAKFSPFESGRRKRQPEAQQPSGDESAPDFGAKFKRPVEFRDWQADRIQAAAAAAVEAIAPRGSPRRGDNNCCRKELASCTMGIDGASGLSSSELATESSERLHSSAHKAAESAGVCAEKKSRQRAAEGESQQQQQRWQSSGQTVEQEEEEADKEDVGRDQSAGESMKAVRDIAKMSIPSLSALQYLPGQLDLSGRPKVASAHSKQSAAPQQQQPQQLRQPLSPFLPNVNINKQQQQRQQQQQQQQQEKQQQQSKQRQLAMGGQSVRVITESSGEDLQHDESCLIHRLCLCNCMSRQQHAAGAPGSAASQESTKRKRRHVKRSKVRSSAAAAAAAPAGDGSGDIGGGSGGNKVNKIARGGGEAAEDGEEDEQGEQEEEEESEEELSTRSEGSKRKVASSEKQSPTFLGLLKSSAVHLTRRQPQPLTSNLVQQQQQQQQQRQRGAGLAMGSSKLGSAGDLEASATGSVSSGSDAPTTSGSLSFLRSRSTSFTASELRRAQSPTSNDYTSIAEDEDDLDDSLGGGGKLFGRSQSACGSRPPSSAAELAGLGAQLGDASKGSKAKSAYKKLLSPSRLFSSRSPSPQQPALLEKIAQAKRGNRQADGDDDDDDVDDDDSAEEPSFLAKSLNRLSGRKSSDKKSRKKQDAKRKLEEAARQAATVGSEPDISRSKSTTKNQPPPVSISQSSLPSATEHKDSSSTDELACQQPGRQATLTARRALVGQLEKQRQGVNRLVARAPQARLTPQIVLSRAEIIVAQGDKNSSNNNNGREAYEMARNRGYATRQEPQHYHYGSGAHTAYSSQRFGSEISADLSTTSGDNLSERALSLPTSPRTARRNYHQERRQMPSPRLRESPVPFRSPPSESTKIEDGLEVCSMEHFEKHIGNIKDTQVETQKHLFTTWINHFCPNLIQRDLVEELKDGIKLIGLLASLTKDTEMVGHYERLARDKRAYINRLVVTPSSRLRHLSNVSIAIDYLREKVGMKLINLNPMDVVNGKPNVVLGLCWNIILHFQFEQNFLKHLESCEDSKILIMEQTLKSWVSYEEARRRLRDWLATAEAKLCDALGPIIMMNSNEELAANQAIGISDLGQSLCSSSSLSTFDPILQHTDRLEDLIKYFELEEAEDPVFGSSSDQLATPIRGQVANVNGNQKSAATAASAESTPIHQAPTCGSVGDNRSISGSLLSLGSSSSRMSSLQSSKTATYRKLFDDFAAKCRILAGMVGRDQRDALLFGVKELKARLKYITEQRVPQVVSELRMSINRCEMSIKEQDEQLASNLSGSDEDATGQLESSSELNGDDDDDSNEASTDLEESKESEANEDDEVEEQGGDNGDDELEQTPTRQQQQQQREFVLQASSPVDMPAKEEAPSDRLASSGANLTSFSESVPADHSVAAAHQATVNGEKREKEACVSEQPETSKKDKISSKNSNGNTGNKGSKNKRAGATSQQAARATKAGNSQPVKTNAGQQNQSRQRGKQTSASNKQDATVAVGAWSLLAWLFASDPVDSSPKLVAKSANSNKRRRHMSPHKSGKSHKSRNNNNRNSPSKQQAAPSKASKDGTQARPDTDYSQPISYTRAVWHKIVRAYHTSLSLNIVLLICLAGICVVPLMHREACCDPNQPSQIISEEALSINERPT